MEWVSFRGAKAGSQQRIGGFWRQVNGKNAGGQGFGLQRMGASQNWEIRVGNTSFWCCQHAGGILFFHCPESSSILDGHQRIRRCGPEVPS